MVLQMVFEYLKCARSVQGNRGAKVCEAWPLSLVGELLDIFPTSPQNKW